MLANLNATTFELLYVISKLYTYYVKTNWKLSTYIADKIIEINDLMIHFRSG